MFFPSQVHIFFLVKIENVCSVCMSETIEEPMNATATSDEWDNKVLSSEGNCASLVKLREQTRRYKGDVNARILEKKK
jgi:hypothetical protein